MPTPFELLGGESRVRALVETFYDTMGSAEPALTALHARDEQGRVARAMRDRFALYLIGWLGGPQDYVAQNGHPRLRMRHGRVPVDREMRDAWLRCMAQALDAHGVTGDVRAFLDEKLSGLADFMRNVDEPGASGA